MNGNNDFNFDDVFSDIFDSVYGERIEQDSLGDYSKDNISEGISSVTGKEKETVQSGSEPDFDPRFKLDIGKNGRKNREYSFGGHRVSSTQEYDYSPSASPEYEELKSSYGGNEEYELDKHFGLIEEDESSGIKSKISGVVNKKKKKQQKKLKAESDEIRAERERRKKNKRADTSDHLYDEEYSGAFNKEDEYLPAPSFKEYISSKLASVILHLRGGIPADGTTGSANAEEEFLGDELDTLSASKYYGSHVHSLRLRARISLFLTVISVYLSLGAPVPGMLSTLKVASAACLAIEFTVMILSLDIITNAILNCFRKKFGADTLAVFSSVVSIIDALTVLNGSGVVIHMPLCSLTTLTLTGILFASLLSARGMRKALRVPAIAKKKYSVTSEMNVTAGKEITILKSSRPITGFVRRMEEAPVDEIVYGKVSLIIAAFSLLLSIVAALLKRSLSRIIYIYSVTLCAAVPFSALMCFALPFFMGSLKIFGNGAALAGWSGIWDLGHSKNLIVTDTDVFPEECVEIENVRIFADYDAEKVISYAGSLILQSGCGLIPAFNSLMSENDCLPVEIDNIEYLAGGGIKGMVDGNIIMVGGTDLMRLMNIRVPYRLVTQTSVLLSINGILYGIFNIKYKADPKVRKALVSLMRSSRHPVFALRDFNVTPEMLREHFDVATDGYDFPPYAERFRISEAKPSLDSQISAVVCREGLGPLTDAADAARRIYIVSMINTGISLAASVVGMFFVFISILSSGAVSVAGLLIFNLLFNVPVLVLGFLTNTFE